MQNQKLDISILFVNWNSSLLIIDCIDSIYQKTKNVLFEIIVIDNHSSDGKVDSIKKKYPEIRLIKNSKNLGFAAANNKALPIIKGKYVILLNPDTLLKNNAIHAMIQFMDNNKDAGICGGRLFNQDNSPSISYGFFPTYWHYFYYQFNIISLFFKKLQPIYGTTFDPEIKEPIKCNWISGANLCMKSDLFKELNGLDEDYFFLFEDVDICYRAKQKGYSTFFIPTAEIYHLNANSLKNSKIQFRQNFYISEFVFLKKHFKFANIVYYCNIIPWLIKYYKRILVGKKEKAMETKYLINNLRIIQNKLSFK